jgi:hypothetical protein
MVLLVRDQDGILLKTKNGILCWCASKALLRLGFLASVVICGLPLPVSPYVDFLCCFPLSSYLGVRDRDRLFSCVDQSLS